MIVEELAQEELVEKLVMERFVLEGHWEWCLRPAVVVFVEEVEDLKQVCLEAVGVAVVAEEKIVVVEALRVADAAHMAVAVLETAEVLAMAAIPLLVSVAERAARVVRDVASEGLYALPPLRLPAELDGVAAPVEVEAAAELLLSEPTSPFLFPPVFWWEHSDRGSAPAHHEQPFSHCPPRR
jgi:hypothetical protein